MSDFEDWVCDNVLLLFLALFGLIIGGVFLGPDAHVEDRIPGAIWLGIALGLIIGMAWRWWKHLRSPMMRAERKRDRRIATIAAMHMSLGCDRSYAIRLAQTELREEFDLSRSDAEL